MLYEQESFQQRQLAALVASKVYYHLGEYEEALSFALGAGSLFDTSLTSDFVETMICN
jgi:26S proteasome regulatory subunit N2